MLAERVAAFVREESAESFEELALALARFQYERSAPFRARCDARGVRVAGLSDWRQVPLAPADALEETTTTESRALTDLDRTIIDRSFPAACLEGIERPPMLSLIPSADDAGDWRLALVADHLLGSWATPDSRVALARRGVEAAKARGFLAARQRDRRPALILATSTTLAQLLDTLDRRGLRFRLPPGSRVVEAGARRPGSPRLLARLAEGLAIPAEAVVREYGAPGSASRFYAGHGRSGEPRPFRAPPWTRVRILDPDSFAEGPAGTAGVISVFDLAAVQSMPHRLTGDRGSAGAEGFRLADGETSLHFSPAS